MAVRPNPITLSLGALTILGLVYFFYTLNSRRVASFSGGSPESKIFGLSLGFVGLGVIVVLVLFVGLKKGNGSNSRGKQQ